MIKTNIDNHKNLQRQAENFLNVGDEVIAYNKSQKIKGVKGKIIRKSASTVTVALKNKETRIPLTTNPKWSRFWRFEPVNMEHGGGIVKPKHSSLGSSKKSGISPNASVIVAGIFAGPSHKQGGISCNQGTYELEGGEAFIDEDFAILTPQKSIYEGTPAHIFDQVLAEQGVKKQKITEATCNLPAGYVLCKAAMQSDEMIKKTHEDTYKSLFSEINKDFGGLEFKKGGKLPKAKGGEIFVIKPQTKNNIKVYTIYDTSNNNQEVEDWGDLETAKEVAEGMNENMKTGGPIKDIYLVQNDLVQNDLVQGDPIADDYQVNKEIETLIDTKGETPDSYTADEKEFLHKYSGYGGIKFEYLTIEQAKGSFSEFYTPD
ncbi:MAG: hypothetical protein AAB875_06415, partial [Patescibacteria group bacterium]